MAQHPCDGGLHQALHAQLVSLSGPGQEATWSLRLWGIIGYNAVQVAHPEPSRTGTLSGSALQCLLSRSGPLSFISRGWAGTIKSNDDGCDNCLPTLQGQPDAKQMPAYRGPHSNLSA